MPDPEARLPDVPELSPQEQDRQALEKQTKGKLGAMKQEFEKQQNEKIVRGSVLEWVRGAQERLNGSDSLARTDLALTAAEQLPGSMRGQWTRNLQTVRNLAVRPNRDGSAGDPIAILRFLANIDAERQTLRKLGQTDTSTQTQEGIRAIEDAFDSYARTIGQGHRAVIVRNPYGYMDNSPIDRRESHLIRTGIFMAAGVGAVATGLLAALAKDGEANTALPATYLLVMGLAMGWGSINQNGSDRLTGQLDFLVTANNDWETLQFGGNGRPAYGVRGPDWGTFAENWYRDGRRDPLIAAFLRAGNKDPATPEQRAAILALAPAGIHPQVNAMINSNRSSAMGADFRMMVGLLNQATTPDAQGIVVNFVRSGATRQNVQQVAKVTAAPGGGPGNGPIGIAPGSPTLFGPAPTGFTAPPSPEPTAKEDAAKAKTDADAAKVKADADATEAARKKAETEAKPKEEVDKDADAKAKQAAKIQADANAAKLKADADAAKKAADEAAKKKVEGSDWPTLSEVQQQQYILKRIPSLLQAWNRDRSQPVEIVPGQVTGVLTDTGIQINGRPLQMLLNVVALTGTDSAMLAMQRAGVAADGRLSLAFARARLLGADRNIPVSQIQHATLAEIIVGTLRGRSVSFSPPRSAWPFGVTSLRITVSRT